MQPYGQLSRGLKDMNILVEPPGPHWAIVSDDPVGETDIAKLAVEQGHGLAGVSCMAPDVKTPSLIGGRFSGLEGRGWGRLTTAVGRPAFPSA